MSGEVAAAMPAFAEGLRVPLPALADVEPLAEVPTEDVPAKGEVEFTGGATGPGAGTTGEVGGIPGLAGLAGLGEVGPGAGVT